MLDVRIFYVMLTRGNYGKGLFYVWQAARLTMGDENATPLVLNTTVDSCVMLQDYNEYYYLDSVCWRRGE